MAKILMNHYSGNKPHPWPWVNFSPEELASNGNGAVQIEHRAANRLQAVRTEWDEPLTLNSAYRDPQYNARIGSMPGSFHIKGQAFDVRVRGWSKAKIRRFVALCYKHGFRGFGGYEKDGKPNFIHIDDRGHPAKWGKSWGWPDEYTAKTKSAVKPKPADKPKTAEKPKHFRQIVDDEPKQEFDR